MSSDAPRRPSLQPWVRRRPPGARNNAVRDPYFSDELIESLEESLRRDPAGCSTGVTAWAIEDAEVLDAIFADDDEWCSRGIGRGGLCSDDICRGLGLCMHGSSCAGNDSGEAS